MALKSCPECGKEVSSTAKRCPHCGYAAQTGGIWAMAILIGVVFLLIMIFAATRTP